MPNDSSLIDKAKEFKPKAALVAAFTGAIGIGAIGTAAAQDICGSDLVTNVLEPLLEAAFQIGPILGALAAIVSLIMMSQVTSKKKKQKWKERRNDAFLYGVIGIMIVGYVIDFFAQNVMDLEDGCLDTSIISSAIDTGVVAVTYLPL